MQLIESSHDDLTCAQGLCSGSLPATSIFFGPCFCACHCKRVVIDGCSVPWEIYDRVKAHARATGRTQFIGVIYDQPAELQPVAGESPWNWQNMLRGNSARAEHMRAGKYLVYTLDQTYQDLKLRSDLAMILWITPMKD